ncbi:MAG: glycosyltransferase family 2 protein [bacterium]
MSHLFYLSLGIVIYTFFGYPLLMYALARVNPLPVHTDDIFPPVSILLCVHNEEKLIERRISNLLSLDYPSDRLEILVGSDGSTDGTIESLARMENKGVRTFIFPSQQGKPSVLNALAREARGELFIFADARQYWEKGALKALMRNFADKSVGMASGLIYEGREGIYRRYENFIRLSESSYGSVPGTSGSFYGLRAELFKPLPFDTILDDFILPMQVIRQGYRSVLEKSAIANDLTFSLAQEKIRKVRTLAGNFQAFFRYPWLLHPGCNPIWFQTVSHKVMRLTIPLFLLLLFISNIALLKVMLFYRVFFIVQIVFYSISIMGKDKIWSDENPWSSKGSISERLLTLSTTFLELNWATILGLWSFLTGRATVTWKKYSEGK